MGLRISVYIALKIPRHIIIVLCVYVCLVALRLLFDCENVSVCDIERKQSASTQDDTMHTLSISLAMRS